VTGPVRHFESVALRPFWALTLVAGITAAFSGAWGSVALAALLLWFLGITGSALHPLQSARDLTEGPLENPAAAVEEELLSVPFQAGMVSRASMHLSMAIGIAGAWIAIVWLHWRWYAALPLAYLLMVWVGGAMRYVFVRRYMSL
jgi:hypothetical protein